ncbi:hypothetical protein WICANDRAFT_62824 [Wickerhamomyces anomalus NRRL Y-366-8]|uniref:Uncharacterized protein n=1 Tax=Wickerhamomyces anomalus (strain ATCC 58044 / CBS 1984 / NCYC 433 / NRRL Y-366-8) TaxID=683960 RepID=A0A1E3P4I7_WICAA|nr:uncharacterized protein WICANDRAFT_62824 [Wickerhamomyces anomalus NRRL Y-366-8]ODQ60263.1 hypothetical protein WICANDRAFT_62824 [Wickerhamomyces anomalus NRRL Y-366-8]
MASTTNSSIKHPKPNNGQSSNGLLSPHMSVLEALQSTANEDENKSPQYSPQFNNFAKHQNTPTFNDFEFTSNTSWHSVGDYLAPRPTSSVLSSSDTEEDTQDHAPLAIKPRQSITSESDEKTIEINMNSGIKDPGSSDGSSFVLPQMFSQINDSNYADQDSKILIIGHKKVQFLHTLDYQLQKRFTLDNHDNYNIILVIFDGLIKIGNILNFIKYNGTQLRNKLFIPIFRNINLRIIDKILRNYNINLLCSPINLDNKYEVNNLLNVLKEDYLLKDSKTVADSIIPLQDNQVAIEQTMNSYQLIRISSSDSDESCEKDGTTNNSLVLQNDPSSISSDKKVMIIRNTPYEIVHHKQSKRSKKLKTKDRIQKKYFLLGISLSVGIGIGITTALTISFLKSKKAVPPPPAPHLNHYKKFTTLTIDQLSKSNDLLKRNLIHFKQHVGDFSKIVYNHSKDYVVKVTHLWDQFVVSASQGVQAGAMLWFF